MDGKEMKTMYNPHSQEIELCLDEFSCFAKDGRVVAGRTFVIELGFDPDICEVILTDDNSLLIKQRGRDVPVSLGPKLWNRVS